VLNIAKKNTFENLSLLKHIEKLKEKGIYFTNDQMTCFGITFKPEATVYDSIDYPGYASISIVNSENDIQLFDFIDTLPLGKNIIKINRELESEKFKKMNHFLSLTCSNAFYVENKKSIKSQNFVTDRFSALLENVQYTAQDVNEILLKIGKIFYIEENSIPISCCIIYKNYENIWEVGAVSTDPLHQGKGYAQKVVSKATAHILKNNHIPRYHVNKNNKKSLSLAIKINYEKFLEIIHYEIIKF
jgi:RimJ/RimL family protein N-acetyltransferase